MKENRFYYTKSIIYGWAVYDRQTNQPAWDACAEILPPVTVNEDGAVYESPVLLESEYKAMRLCARLNLAWKRVSKK